MHKKFLSLLVSLDLRWSITHLLLHVVLCLTEMCMICYSQSLPLRKVVKIYLLWRFKADVHGAFYFFFLLLYEHIHAFFPLRVFGLKSLMLILSASYCVRGTYKPSWVVHKLPIIFKHQKSSEDVGLNLWGVCAVEQADYSEVD